MISNTRNPWESKSPQAPHMTGLEELSTWLKAAGVTSHPLHCLLYILSLTLGLFIAQEHVGHVPSSTIYALIALVFGVYSGLHMLFGLIDYRHGNDSGLHAQLIEKKRISPLTLSLSFILLYAIATLSTLYLMIQSAHPWLSLVLLTSMTLALFAVTPPIYKDSCRTISRINAYGAHGIVCIILFGTAYAVLSQNFAPYYLALTIPMLTMPVLMASSQRPQISPLCSFPIYLAMLALVFNYVPSVKPEQSLLLAPIPKASLERCSSLNTHKDSQDAMDRGVVYGFGVKNSKTGSIDCSGWVEEMNRNMMRSTNERLGREVFDEKARLALLIGANGGAAGIVLAVAVATGEQLLNEDLTPDKVREGLTIGLDTGVKSWDSGRYGGIDHIVQTYKDPETGVMMVSQSSGGIGVHVMSYADWYAEWNTEAKLYGVDMSLLASPAPVPSL